MAGKSSGDDVTLATALHSATKINEYKIIVIGALGVGKTSLLMRYVHDQFQDRISTFIAEKEKVVTVDGQEISLRIWDTAGQERYQSITNRFYADTRAVIVVYDIVHEESWTDVDFWVRELNYYLLNELDEGMPVLFVGNKKDLVDKRDDEQKVVNFRQVQEVANAYGFLPPIEVSAKTGHGVDKAFMRVVKHLKKETKDTGGPIIPKPPGPGCCSII